MYIYVLIIISTSDGAIAHVMHTKHLFFVLVFLFLPFVHARPCHAHQALIVLVSPFFLVAHLMVHVMHTIVLMSLSSLSPMYLNPGALVPHFSPPIYL